MSSVSHNRLEEEYNRLLGQESISLREILTAVVESGDGIILADKDGKIRYANQAYERMTGYLEKELIGASPSIISSGLHTKKFYDGMWKRLLSGKVFQGEFINRKKNGELYYQSETVAPVKDAAGKIVGFVSNGRDVTEDRYQEKKLALVGKMSSLFFGEMRDPLRRIQMAAMNLRDLAKKKNTKDVFKDLDVVFTTSRQMEVMLDALYEFLNPSFAKGGLADIKGIIQRTLLMVEPAFTGQGVTFSVEFDESTSLPEVHERQWKFVLAELLHHYGAIAIGQSKAASKVHISVKSSRSNLVIAIEGGKGTPVNSRGACSDTCGCVWVDGMDIKFILMELVVSDAKGIINYESVDGTVKTTLVIPQGKPSQP